MAKYTAKNATSTPYTGIIQKYLNEDDGKEKSTKKATFTAVHADRFIPNSNNRKYTETIETQQTTYKNAVGTAYGVKGLFGAEAQENIRSHKLRQTLFRILRISMIIILAIPFKQLCKQYIHPRILFLREGGDRAHALNKPDFIFEHPYVTSSYYTSTNATDTLLQTQKLQVDLKRDRASDRDRGIVSRLAIVRPFCFFDAEGLPSTFTCWNSLVPCRAAEQDLGDFVDEDEVDEWVLFDMSTNGTGRKLHKDEEENWECEADYNSTSWFRGMASSLFKRCKRKPKTKAYFDDVPADGLRTTSADLFLFYSQTFADQDGKTAINSVDEIMKEFFSPGGMSSLFLSVYCQ